MKNPYQAYFPYYLLLKKINKILSGRLAVTAIEYGLVAAFIIVFALSALVFAGSGVNGVFQKFDSTVGGAVFTSYGQSQLSNGTASATCLSKITSSLQAKGYQCNVSAISGVLPDTPLLQTSSAANQNMYGGMQAYVSPNGNVYSYTVTNDYQVPEYTCMILGPTGGVCFQMGWTSLVDGNGTTFYMEGNNYMEITPVYDTIGCSNVLNPYTGTYMSASSSTIQNGMRICALG